MAGVIEQQKIDKRLSFTSANVFPAKVIQDKEVLDTEGKIQPRHIQLNITNKCNLSCSFCSCADRDKPEVMSLRQVQGIAKDYSMIGCEAVTITGGGEPTLHMNINEIIETLYMSGMRVGMVTNGIKLGALSPYGLEMLDWVRISFDDSRDFDQLNKVLIGIIEGNDILPDFSFSYVLSRNPDYVNMEFVISFANQYNFSHVRVVSDLLDLKYVPDMDSIKGKMHARVDDSKVIYQGRKSYTRGAKKCLISLLKPVIDVDGNIYPCCGVQYAREGSNDKYNSAMCMGSVKMNIEYIYEDQEYFDGSKCDRCYYSKYNEVLGAMTADVIHGEFV